MAKNATHNKSAEDDRMARQAARSRKQGRSSRLRAKGKDEKDTIQPLEKLRESNRVFHMAREAKIAEVEQIYEELLDTGSVTLTANTEEAQKHCWRLITRIKAGSVRCIWPRDWQEKGVLQVEAKG